MTDEKKLQVVAHLGNGWVMRDGEGKSWSVEIKPSTKTTIFGTQNDGWAAIVEEHEVLPDGGGHWGTEDEAYEAARAYILGQDATLSDE
jgi:hypothetical protein